MKNCEYWIWLQRTLGYAAKTDDIINYYGSAKVLYEAGSYEWRVSGIMTSNQIERLSRYSPSESGQIIRACTDNFWKIITPDDEEYPPSLREISNFPAVLYVDGDEKMLSNKLFIAMVGTRNSSEYGRTVAYTLSGEISKTGLTVVSGGALGIDSAAHKGAIDSGAKTVAVLGCGLGTDYLKGNEALRREIAKHGALITEYAPFTSASRYTFPKRNRIISGMSLGTVVVEAGEKSGSLITARLAVEQRRDVFAVPGDLLSSAYTGANKLIREGAKPVFTAADVAQEYFYLYDGEINIDKANTPLSEIVKRMNVSVPVANESQKTVSEKTRARKTSSPAKNEAAEVKLKKLPEDVSANAKTIYELIGNEISFDDMVIRSGLPAFKVMTAISELEIKGVIEAVPGRKYKKI